MYKIIFSFAISFFAASAYSQDVFNVGDRVSFPENNWIWVVDSVRPDLEGGSIVAPGIDGETRRLFVAFSQLLKVEDLVNGYESGSCYKIPANSLIWKIAGLTAGKAGLAEPTAYMFNPSVAPRGTRRAVLINDLLERFDCPF